MSKKRRKDPVDESSSSDSEASDSSSSQGDASNSSSSGSEDEESSSSDDEEPHSKSEERDDSVSDDDDEVWVNLSKSFDKITLSGKMKSLCNDLERLIPKGSHVSMLSHFLSTFDSLIPREKGTDNLKGKEKEIVNSFPASACLQQVVNYISQVNAARGKTSTNWDDFPAPSPFTY